MMNEIIDHFIATTRQYFLELPENDQQQISCDLEHCSESIDIGNNEETNIKQLD